MANHAKSIRAAISRRLGDRFPRRLKLTVAAVMVAGSLLMAGWILLASGKVPGGVRVAGVDIGGLAPAAARARLVRELADDIERPIPVVAAGHRYSVVPAEAGLSLDVHATVAAAAGGTRSPAGVWRSVFGGSREVAPKVTVDTARLSAAVAGIAREVDRPRREGRIRYQGTRVVAILPRPGNEIDRAATGRAIAGAFLIPGRQVTVSPRPTTPTVTAREVKRVARSSARSAVARPFVLTRGARKVVLPPERLARYLSFVADGSGSLRPRFDAAAAAREVEKKFVPAARAPRDATFEVRKRGLTLVPARTGQGIETEGLAGAVSDALVAANGAGSVQAGSGRTVRVELVTTPPRITDEEARAMGIKEKISQFTTRHPCCAPRVTNIHRIADIVDGHIVKPGETFSLNGLVGERDAARGFVPAPMILNGRYVDDVGGGVSQFATTMFNAVFFGGLQDVQHTPHMFSISRYPAGRESTVSYPEPDFRWRNDSPYGVLIKTSYTSTSLTVAFWSTKRFDIKAENSERYEVKGFTTASDSGPKCIPMPGAEGFSIDVWRIFRKDGKTVRRQKFHTVYQPEPRLTCGGAETR